MRGRGRAGRRERSEGKTKGRREGGRGREGGMQGMEGE